jgi:putative heme-binding domain-containing protein
VLQVAQLHDQLAALADDEAQPAAVRLEALRAIVTRPPGLSGASFDFLVAQLDRKSPALDRLAAAEVLGRSRLDGAQALTVIDKVEGDPLIPPLVLLPALTDAASADPQAAERAAEYLLTSIRRGWRPAEQELAAALKVLPAGSADQVRALLAGRDQAARAKLDAFRPLLDGGDPERGRAVFFGNKVACATCHRVGGRGGGGVVGPDLTKVGAVRGGGDILESVLLPSSTTAQGFDNYVVATTDGRVLAGVIVRRTADALVLRDSGGAEVQVKSKQVRTLRRSTVSMMPEGLEQGLAPDEFRDLMAFLQSLK